MNNAHIPQYIVNVAHLRKSFSGLLAIKDLSLKITPGTLFGFMGPNGSGKTTSIRLLSGLIIPDQGTGQCLGYDLFTQTKQLQSHIGYMPQRFCLYRNLSVYENLDFIARIYNIPARRQRIQEVLAIFELTPIVKQTTGTLSGGWQQRVSLAAAVLNRPSLLFLDEPTSGIDAKSRLDIWQHLQKFVYEGMTVIMSTHDMDEAERCQQLAYLTRGEIVMFGSVTDVIQHTQLFTWRVRGKQLNKLSSYLNKNPSIVQIIEKGNELRMSAKVSFAIQQLDPTILKDYEIKETETTLEDAFIYNLKNRSQAE